MVLLSGGALPDGSRLYSAGTARQITQIVTPLAPSNPPPELAPLRNNFAGYALGLNVRDYRGRKMWTHTGGLPGYVSRVMMLPEMNLGVTVLTNQESGEAFDAIAYHIVDHYLGAPAFDWIEANRKTAAATAARTAEVVKNSQAARDASSKPSLPLPGYAGTYEDAWYGAISITMEKDRLVMRFGHTPSLVADLEHWQHDTFVAKWRDRELRADAYVTFALNPDGSIDQARMAAVSPETDFSFDFQDLLLKPVKAVAK
jgi:hypothetical protein